jgi:hypothetical protein
MRPAQKTWEETGSTFPVPTFTGTPSESEAMPTGSVPGNLGTVEHPAAIPARVTEAVGAGMAPVANLEGAP